MSVAAVITGIVAFIRAIPIVDKYVQMIIAQYVTTTDQKTSAAIVDAASMAAGAKTDEERYAASTAWQNALSRTRIIN